MIVPEPVGSRDGARLCRHEVRLGTLGLSRSRRALPHAAARRRLVPRHAKPADGLELDALEHKRAERRQPLLGGADEGGIGVLLAVLERIRQDRLDQVFELLPLDLVIVILVVGEDEPLQQVGLCDVWKVASDQDLDLGGGLVDRERRAAVRRVAHRGGGRRRLAGLAEEGGVVKVMVAEV
eukprot:5995028-Prymnesium_polylepis.1